jgi:antagonist of KipI
VKVLAPGLLTTVQDLGRVGFAKQGVSPSGAMDGNALRAANLLVGNNESAAGLEITSGGVGLEFRKRALIAICGADVSPAISGVAVPSWRAIYVQDGWLSNWATPAGPGARTTVCSTRSARARSRAREGGPLIATPRSPARP